MATLTHIETDTGTNVDISSATAIGSYTSTGDKLVMVDVSIDAVAGNGDYVMYVKRQINGTGSSYIILPKTTMAAASGETAISGQSGWITVRKGDVLTCYVDGLAGDTSTPDWSTRWFELAGVTAAAVADAICDEALSDHTSAGTLAKAIADVESDATAILEDTGNTLDGLIKDVPTVAEFEARTKPAADYALEATLTAIKGAGWTNETLAAIDTLIDAIKAKSDLIPAQPAAVGSAMTLTSAYDAAKSAASQSSVNAIPTAPLLAANYTAPDNAGITAIKAKTDNLPASPAAVGSLMGLADGAITDAKIATDALSAAKIKADAVTKIQNGLAKPGDAMTLTGAYDKAKDDVLTPLAAAKSVVDAVKAKTDNLPASPAQAGEYTAAIAAIPTTPLLAANYTAPDNASISAIKAKTDTIPASPAVAGEYTASIAAIQADLDNPNQYKADVSGIPDALLAKVIVGTLTLEQVLKVLAAVEIGITTGGGTETIVYTGIDGTIIRLTGVDENGNRTAVIVTPGA